MLKCKDSGIIREKREEICRDIFFRDLIDANRENESRFDSLDGYLRNRVEKAQLLEIFTEEFGPARRFVAWRPEVEYVASNGVVAFALYGDGSLKAA